MVMRIPWNQKSLMLSIAIGVAVSVGPAPATAQPGNAEVNGVRLHYELSGAGTPLILVHGWTSNLDYWDDQVGDFRKRYRVLRYDRRGFGRSSGVPDISMDPADLDGLLQTLRMPAGFVLGHSQGGRVALDFTLAYPKRVKALILFGSGPPQGFGLPWSGPDSMPRGQMVKAARAFGIDSIWSFLSNHPLVTNDRLDAATAARLRKIRKTYRGADLLTDLAPAGPAVGTATRLREIQAPTLVLVGDKELPYLKVVAEALGYGIPNATKVVIPGGGHLINLSQRAAFNQAVLGFLATHDRH